MSRAIARGAAVLGYVPVKLAGAHVRYEAVDGVGWITLTRPQVLSALDAQLAADPSDSFSARAPEPRRAETAASVTSQA
jgi:hypothetical protein